MLANVVTVQDEYKTYTVELCVYKNVYSAFQRLSLDVIFVIVLGFTHDRKLLNSDSHIHMYCIELQTPNNSSTL